MVTINNKYLSCRLISIPWKTVTHWLLVDVFLLPSPPLPMFGGFLPLVFGYDSNQCHREVGHGMVYIQELDQQYLPENSDSSIGSDQFPYGRVWKYSIPSKWACNEENEWMNMMRNLWNWGYAATLCWDQFPRPSATPLAQVPIIQAGRGPLAVEIKRF